MVDYYEKSENQVENSGEGEYNTKYMAAEKESLLYG